MFVLIADQKPGALLGNVYFEFAMEEYLAAQKYSPNVPVMQIGPETNGLGRQWLVDRLREQSAKATGT